MMKRIVLPLILALVVVQGCTEKRSINITGTARKNAGEQVIINLIDVNSLQLIDSAKIGKNGKFRFRFKSETPEFYQIGISSNNFVSILASPGEKIVLNFPDSLLHNGYSTMGSDGSEKLRLLDLKLANSIRSLDSLTALYVALPPDVSADARKTELDLNYRDIAASQRKYNIEFVINNTTSLAAIKALYQKLNDQTYVLYETRDLQYLKIVSDSLGKYYPESRQVKALITNFENEMREYNSRQLINIASQAPEAVLDPDLPDMNGKNIKLSSIKNKYVLLSFWTTESRDCIAENLQLKQLYSKYAPKGFEIYQISLDQDENAWKNAVKFDDLPWINTRENPENPQNAILFNVKSVPVNYLFNPEGDIVALDLHGKALQLKLEQLFPN